MGRRKKEEVQGETYMTTETKEVETIISEGGPVVVDIPIIPSEKIEVQNKEEKIQTSEYLKKELTADEVNQSQSIKDSLDLFLKKVDLTIYDDAVKTTIPTGIDSLDTVLGGGIATGFTQIVGPPGGGKSALAAKILAAGQRKYAGKFIGVYIDSEESTTESRLAQLGVIYPKIKPYVNVSVEKIFQIVEGICAFKDNNPHLMDVPSVVIWDSIANTVTEAGYEADDPNSVTGQKARLLSFLLPKYIANLNKYSVCLVAVNQLRDKIDMGIIKTAADLKFLGDKQIPGGKSILFNSIQLLLVRPSTDIKGEYGFTGIKVMCKAVKNKLFTPNIEIPLVFSFERGFSNFWSNYEMLKNFKRISAAAWCTLGDYTEKKFRQNQAIEFYRTDPKFKELFDSLVQEVLKKEYIDTYSNTAFSTVETDW
jgi:recombination protein RecA